MINEKEKLDTKKDLLPEEVLFNKIKDLNGDKVGDSTWAKVVLHFNEELYDISKRNPNEPVKRYVELMKEESEHYQDLIQNGLDIPDDALGDYIKSHLGL